MLKVSSKLVIILIIVINFFVAFANKSISNIIFLCIMTYSIVTVEYCAEKGFLNYVIWLLSKKNLVFLFILTLAILKLLFKENINYHISIIFSDTVFLPLLIYLSSYHILNCINELEVKTSEKLRYKMLSYILRSPLILLVGIISISHYIYDSNNLSTLPKIIAISHGMLCAYYVTIFLIVWIVFLFVLITQNNDLTSNHKSIHNLVFYNPIYVFKFIFPLLWGAGAIFERTEVESYIFLVVIFFVLVDIMCIFIALLKKLQIKYLMFPIVIVISNILFINLINEVSLLLSNRTILSSVSGFLIFILVAWSIGEDSIN